MSDENKYSGNGQYSLNKLSLFYIEGEEEKELSLIGSFVNLDLYESIWDSAMSGQISIIDSFNIQDILPIYGDERIELSFHTSGNENNPVEFKGKVYKVSEKHRLTEHSSGFTIFFSSAVTIVDNRTNIQRGYKDTCSNIVSSIYETFLKNHTEKEISVVDSQGIHTLVLGNFSPLEGIALASSKAFSVNNEAGYIFFENNQEFNFKPLQFLYTQEPVTEYIYRNPGTFKEVDQRFVERFNAIQDIKVMEENSFLDRVMEGLHGSTHMYLDLNSKEYTKIKYSKDSFFDKTKSLGKLASKKDVNDPNFQDMTVIKYGSDNLTMAEKEVRSFMAKIEASLIRVQITVFGDSFIKSGDVCLSTIPNWNTDQENIKDTISGKFLISEIHHSMSSNQYQQYLMLQKESYESL